MICCLYSLGFACDFELEKSCPVMEPLLHFLASCILRICTLPCSWPSLAYLAAIQIAMYKKETLF
uniref:Uncharacterized protein n=1 Tax=Rhizophora mucronata TaxID=61149 RepID=A0A2P2Q6Q6_RHIMU